MSRAFTTGTEAGQQGSDQIQLTQGLTIGDTAITVSDSGAIAAAENLGITALTAAETLGRSAFRSAEEMNVQGLATARELGTAGFDLAGQIVAEGRVANQEALATSSGLFSKFGELLTQTANRANDLAGRTGEALVNLVSKQTTGETVTADKNRSWIPWAALALVVLGIVFLSRPRKS